MAAIRVRSDALWAEIEPSKGRLGSTSSTSPSSATPSKTALGEYCSDSSADWTARRASLTRAISRNRPPALSKSGGEMPHYHLPGSRFAQSRNSEVMEVERDGTGQRIGGKGGEEGRTSELKADLVLGGSAGNATLDARARSLLASSIRTLGGAGPGGGAGGGERTRAKPRSKGAADDPLVYLAPCPSGVADGVVESTSALVASRTLSKIGRSDLAWDFLRTLFSAQGKDGFVPKYVYVNRTEWTEWEGKLAEGVEWTEFVGPYPGPALFPESIQGRTPERPCRTHDAGSESRCEVGIWSSHSVGATPLHATYVLEAFYLSDQTEGDVAALEELYPRLGRWHERLHRRVVADCSGNGSGRGEGAGDGKDATCSTAVRGDLPKSRDFEVGGEYRLGPTFWRENLRAEILYSICFPFPRPGFNGPHRFPVLFGVCPGPPVWDMTRVVVV